MKIKIGKILRPFGIKGALKILLSNPKSKSLKPGVIVYFNDKFLKKKYYT